MNYQYVRNFLLTGDVMIPYGKEKTENAIAFFAKEHRKKTRKVLFQTFLYKYLALLDFSSLEETGMPALDLTYMAMERGPVPIDIYRNQVDTDLYAFKKNEGGGVFIIAKSEPDLDYFSDREIALMGKLIEIYAAQWVTTGVMSDVSHGEILAWQRAWRQKKNSIIDYKLNFKDDLDLKAEDKLTFPEEVFLTYRAITS